MLSQMLGIYLRSVKETLATRPFARVMDSAEPGRDGEMLGAFVALPISLAPEGLCAMGKGTSIRAIVAFLVFSIAC